MHNPKLTTTRPKSLAIAVTASILSVIAGQQKACALGITLPDQDAFATARGNAFVATANDPAAVFYNPAGLTQLSGADFSMGAYGIVYSDRYTGPRGSVNAKTEWAALPQVFSSLSLSKYHLTLGFGTYSPFGLRMAWPGTAPFYQRSGQIDYETASPIIAYEVCKHFSLAAGPTLNYSTADLKFFPGFNDHFHGDATSAGYTVGALFNVNEQHYFGATYRSATEMNYDGHGTVPIPPFSANAPVSADFHFPKTVAFGYSYRPTRDWNIELDANWTDWSTLKTVAINPLPEALAFNWNPSWMIDAGVTRYFCDCWRVSGGFMYSMNSTPHTDFDPLVADSDRYLFSLGVGRTWKHISFDAAYQFGWGPSRTITSDTATPTANGSYEFFSHALTINLGYHF